MILKFSKMQKLSLGEEKMSLPTRIHKKKFYTFLNFYLPFFHFLCTYFILYAHFYINKGQFFLYPRGLEFKTYSIYDKSFLYKITR